jgi:hypothetical protein
MYQERSNPRTNRFNNDLYPDDENAGYVYFQNHHQEMKVECTDRKYPFRSALSSDEARTTVYVPFQPTPSPFTRSDQYGIPSPKVELEKVTPGSRVRQVKPAMTHASSKKINMAQMNKTKTMSTLTYVVYMNPKFNQLSANFCAQIFELRIRLQQGPMA